MVKCLCIASLLIVPISTALAQSPSAKAAQSPPAKPVVNEVSIKASRLVTSGYLRMNDPGFVARLLQRANTPEGKRMAASVLPPETLAQRDQLLDVNRAYLRGVSLVKPPAKGVRTIPARPSGTPPPGGDKPEIGKPVKGGGKYLNVGKLADFGSVFQSETESASYEYHGVAHHTGTLKIKDPGSAAISVERVDVYTGEIVDNKPVVAAGSGKGSQFEVTDGQDYMVRLHLDLHKAGDYSADIPVDDGSHVVTLEAKGKVLEAHGGFACWVKTKGFYLIPGTSQPGALHIAIKGNAPTTVKVSGTGPSGVSVSSTPHPAKANDEFDLPFNVTAPPGAANAQGAIGIQVSAYDGKASLTAQASATVETVWSGGSYEQSSGDTHIAGTFKFSSGGNWEYTVAADDHSITLGDLVVCAVLLEHPLPNKHHLGVWLDFGEVGGVGVASTKMQSASGYDQRLLGVDFIHSTGQGFLLSDGSLNNDAGWAKFQYWRDSNSFEDLAAY